MISECRDKLTREKTNRGTPKSSATVNRYMAILSHLFNVPIRKWMGFNPLTRIKKLTESGGTVRFLDKDERDQLLKACKENLLWLSQRKTTRKQRDAFLDQVFGATQVLLMRISAKKAYSIEEISRSLSENLVLSHLS
jgi:integrase